MTYLRSRRLSRGEYVSLSIVYTSLMTSVMTSLHSKRSKLLLEAVTGS